MNNAPLAEILQTIGRLLEIKEENPFKVRAYFNAARTIGGLSESVEVLIQKKTLGELPGIGPALEEKITQLATTGKLKYYEDLRAEIPAGLLAIMDIPSVGPKKARILWKEKGIVDVDALRNACLEDKLLDIKGFGEKAQKKILEGIDFHRGHSGQYLLSTAMPVALRLVEYLSSSKHALRVSLAGSLRRWKEVVRDIDILAGSKSPAKLMEQFLKAEGVREILAQGETKSSIRLSSGIQVDLRVVSDDQFPSALVYFTGSKEHNVALRSLALKKGLKVSEYGIFKGEKALPCRDEAEFYARLGLPCLPPEMRENTGEMELSKIPDLVDRESLKGVFHTHSTWSDGTATIEAMAEKARSMGLRYMGLSDHSKVATYANGMDEARLRKQMKEIDRLNKRWGDFKILKGLECDILPDGELDLNPKVLGELDFVIGSIHSRFDMDEETMTKRICKALGNKELDILGHSTGRLLLDRAGYKVNLDRVLDRAKECGKMVELNANPHRLDLDWIHCRRAKEKGIMIPINPDAHSTAGLEDIDYGIGAARRGWLEKKDILNTRDLDEVKKILN